MSYPVDNIISILTRISPQGLALANFGLATLFAPETELPAGFLPDTRRVYNSLTALSVDFVATTETYKAASKWLGGVPANNHLIVYGVATADATWTTTLDKARNQYWWFWSFFTATVYADVGGAVGEIAAWSNTNESMFPNCQTTTEAAKIRDPNETTDIATILTTAGYRTTYTFAHATDPYAGIASAKWLAVVNYSGERSTITLEFKKLAGTAAESLTGTEYNAMRLDTKKTVFYTAVDLQGSTDAGRIINTYTHSTFGEYIDDVVNLSAFVNALKVTLYNTLANNVTKVGQDPIGQDLLLGAARSVGEQYILNDYLGPRNYTDPDDGIEKFTEGYEILTKPEDILDLSGPDLAARKSAPIRMRIFRKGAIHVVNVSVDVY
ncbi:MAG: DUF3383 family protein [candidate division Zixibacteria bacterium]|nr:DUF3383 family protein [candidate division Zixibacteria bacterium]